MSGRSHPRAAGSGHDPGASHEVGADRRAVRHEQTRLEILDAAQLLASREGAAGWTMAQLGRAVGMKAPSLYQYFDSKAAVLDALFARGFSELVDRVTAALRGTDLVPGRRREVLGLIAKTFAEFCAEDPARYRLMFVRVVPGFEPTDAAFVASERALDVLRQTLQQIGIADADDVELWLSIMDGMVARQLANDPGGSRTLQLLPQAVDMFANHIEGKEP